MSKIKKNYKSYEGLTPFVLALIIILGFFYRLSMAHIAWIDPDEGTFLYDASLLLKGLAPYKDYFTRNPFYLGMLAFFVKLFGHNLLAGRLLSVIISTITIYFIYKIGKRLYDTNTGILASSLFAFAPYTVFWNSLVKNQSVQIFFVVVAVYLFLYALEKEKNPIFFLNGLFFGIALLFRETAFLLLLIEAIAIFYLRKSAKFFFWSCAGFCIPLLGYLYFCQQAGTGTFFNNVSNSAVFIISGFGLNYFLDKDVSLVRNSLFFLKEALYLAVPAFMFFFLILKESAPKKYKKAINGLFNFSLLAGFSICLYWILASPFKWLFVKESYLVALFKMALSLLFATLFLSSLYLYKKSSAACNQKHFSHIFPSIWFIVFLLTFLLRKRFYFPYFMELLPVLSLMAGFALISLFRQKGIPKSAYATFIASLVCFAVLTQLFYIQGYKLDRFYSVNENKQIADFLKKHTSPSEEIFTANNLALFCAERRAVKDISYPYFYSYPEISSSPQNFNYPGIREIMNYIETQKIRYCLIEPWTENYFFVPYPHFKELIYSQYRLEKEIGDAKIYIRK